MKTTRTLLKIFAVAVALAMLMPWAMLAQSADPAKPPATFDGDRADVLRKLREIRLDTVQYDGLPLAEVVKHLRQETIARDPFKKGINFTLNQNVPQPAVSAPGRIVDPTTGLPLPEPAPSEQMDIYSVIIKLGLPVTDVRLVDVLDLIVKVADHPITYTVENYGVVFSPAESGAGRETEAAFSFPGGTPRDFVKAVQEHFRVDWKSVTDLPKEMEAVRIPPLRLNTASVPDTGSAASGGSLGALVSLYNQVGEQDAELGHLVVRGNLAKPSVVTFVPSKAAENTRRELVVKAFSIYGLSDEAKARLQEDIQRATNEALNYARDSHGPGSARELDGAVALHRETNLLVAAGQETYVEMVESIVTACMANERAAHPVSSAAPTNSSEAK